MSARRCESCGEWFEVSLRDYWPEDRAFAYMTCCAEVYQDVLDWHADALDGDRDARRAFCAFFLEETGVDVRGLFVSESTGQTAYAPSLQLVEGGPDAGQVPQKTVKAFVREHHANHPKPPAGWLWGHAILLEGELVAVAMVGRPVSRVLAADGVVEVNRVAVRRDIDRQLVADACSMLYGAAARKAKKRGAPRIVTYTLEAEAGTSLRAAGWTVETKTKGGTWDTPSRRREDHAPTGKKTRWGKTLAA